ncbi:DDE Tnp IS1595 domain-containing protein, partial [Aphis craccivora]
YNQFFYCPIRYHENDYLFFLSRSIKIWYTGIYCRFDLFENLHIFGYLLYSLREVIAGSIIHSDGWSGYNGLSDLGYNYYVQKFRRSYIQGTYPENRKFMVTSKTENRKKYVWYNSRFAS